MVWFAEDQQCSGVNTFKAANGAAPFPIVFGPAPNNPDVDGAPPLPVVPGWLGAAYDVSDYN